MKVFEQLAFETVDFVHPLKSVKIGRAILETSNCENLLKIKIDHSGRNFNIVEKGKKMPMESVVRTSMTQFVFSWNTIQM
jgi:hypothetical protein